MLEELLKAKILTELHISEGTKLAFTHHLKLEVCHAFGLLKTITFRMKGVDGRVPDGWTIRSCPKHWLIRRGRNCLQNQEVEYWRLCYHWSPMLLPSPFLLRLCQTNRYWSPSEMLKVPNGVEFLQSLKCNISITYSGLRNPFPKHRLFFCHTFFIIKTKLT